MVPFATVLGLVIGAIPVAMGMGIDALAVRITSPRGSLVAFAGALALAAKHFVQLRSSGGDRGASRVDDRVIGIVDPIARPTPVLLDTFRFDPLSP